MKKKIFRLALTSTALLLALPLSFAASNFPKTSSCPIDGGTGHSTGKTRKGIQSACTDVEYKHQGTDYSDPRHPQKFNHLFWVTHCTE